MGTPPPHLSALSRLQSKRIDKYRMELTRKKCKTAILLYCFHTAGQVYFTQFNLLSPGTSYLEKISENYLIFSKSILEQHFMHSLIHFSINLIKRRNSYGYIQGSYCVIVIYSMYFVNIHMNCTL